MQPRTGRAQQKIPRQPDGDTDQCQVHHKGDGSQGQCPPLLPGELLLPPEETHQYAIQPGTHTDAQAHVQNKHHPQGRTLHIVPDHMTQHPTDAFGTQQALHLTHSIDAPYPGEKNQGECQQKKENTQGGGTLLILHLLPNCRHR